MSHFPAPARLLEELETPAAVVELDVLAGNLDRMAAYAALHGLALRPHVKTHKAPRIAAEQLRLGAVGLTCATPREVEVMSDVTDDVLLAYPPVGRAKLSRLLAATGGLRFTVALDSVEVAKGLAAVAEQAARRVGVYVEADLGMRRVGVPTPEACVALASFVTESSWLDYRGIAFYPGQIREPVAEQGPKLQQLGDDLGRVIDALRAAGLRPPVVSGGSTPAAWRMHEVPGITEVRPGTYVYNDRTTAALDACQWDEIALTVLATVVSTAVPGQAVIDAGSKALGREPLPSPVSNGRGRTQAAGDPGYGALLDRPEVTVLRMSEEHGILDLSRTQWRPTVGDVVRVVPNHACIVVHLNDTVYGARGEIVETQWAVAARGRDRLTDVSAAR
jgi:D-serine deaminase-like pyridoxal phosphate-dependent protein